MNCTTNKKDRKKRTQTYITQCSSWHLKWKNLMWRKEMATSSSSAYPHARGCRVSSWSVMCFRMTWVSQTTLTWTRLPGEKWNPGDVPVPKAEGSRSVQSQAPHSQQSGIYTGRLSRSCPTKLWGSHGVLQTATQKQEGHPAIGQAVYQ